MVIRIISINIDVSLVYLLVVVVRRSPRHADDDKEDEAKQNHQHVGRYPKYHRNSKVKQKKLFFKVVFK